MSCFSLPLKFAGTTERNNKFGTFIRSQGVLGDDSGLVSLTRNRNIPVEFSFVSCSVHTGGRERNRDVRDGGAYCVIHAWGFIFPRKVCPRPQDPQNPVEDCSGVLPRTTSTIGASLRSQDRFGQLPLGIATIPVGIPGVGGDICYGADSVWTAKFGIPLTRIDTKSNKVSRQWVGRGGDALRFGYDSIWLTDYHRGLLWRIPNLKYFRLTKKMYAEQKMLCQHGDMSGTWTPKQLEIIRHADLKEK